MQQQAKTGFALATLSDLYNKSGVFIDTKFSIFDAVIEDFYDGAAVVPRNKCTCALSYTLLSNGEQDVFHGTTSYNGAIRWSMKDKRAQNAYKLVSDLKRMVLQHTNWKPAWLKNRNIQNNNKIPVLFYTSNFLDLNLKLNLTKPAVTGKNFIAIPVHSENEHCGYAVVQKVLFNMTGDREVGVRIFDFELDVRRVANFKLTNFQDVSYIPCHTFSPSVGLTFSQCRFSLAPCNGNGSFGFSLSPCNGKYFKRQTFSELSSVHM